LLTNGVFMAAAFEAGNYSLSLALAAAAVWCLCRPGSTASRLLAGGLLGLAISAKLSFLFVAAGLAVGCFAWERRTRDLLCLVAGIVVGALPTLYFLVRGPTTFFFLTYTFHHLTNLHRGLPGRGDWFSIAKGVGRLALTLAPLLALTGFALAKATASGPRASRRGLLAIAIVLASSFAGALSPLVFFKTYWNLPVGLVAVACLWGIASWGRTKVIFSLLIAANVGLCLMYAGWDTWNLARPHGTALEVRAVQRAFKQQAWGFRACLTDVLTPVAPLTLGSGVPLARGSSAGPFLFRLDDDVAATAARYRRFTDFTSFLGPRTALFVGYYPEEPFEGRMAAYAEGHGFQRQPAIHFRGRDLVLYVPQRCAAPAGHGA
ncbi:MAG TPA: hypothetical protein VHU40_00940, partial [Polyangia bacterium]|nr:hypothetical protein [Polyangia bacterium]